MLPNLVKRVLVCRVLQLRSIHETELTNVRKLFTRIFSSSSSLVVQSNCQSCWKRYFHCSMKILKSEKFAKQESVSLLKMNQHAKDIFLTAVNSVVPREMIERELKYFPNESLLKIRNSTYELNKNVYIVGFGKAVSGMARAVEDILGDHIVEGVISVSVGIESQLQKTGRQDLLLKSGSKIRVFEGAKYNLPDENAYKAAKEIQAVASKLRQNDLLLVLISGGGSALLPLPWPPITLEEEVAVTSLMSLKGATILDLNTVRKHIEVLKGGGLALAAGQANVVSLIISDVIGDPLDVIASGPTVRDTTTFHHCLQILQRLDILDKVPTSILDRLNRKKEAESAQASTSDHSIMFQPTSHEFQWSQVQNILIGTNEVATKAAGQKAQELGYVPVIISTTLSGEAREVGQMFASLTQFITMFLGYKASRAKPGELARMELALLSSGLDKTCLNEVHTAAHMAQNKSLGLCIIAGGETVVKVKGTGKGGRNQEMVLSMAIHLQELLGDWGGNVLDRICFCSAGTDGQDGPTDAAGTIITGTFTTEAESQGIDLNAYLDKNDAYTLFSTFKNGSHLLKTGLTSTNVMDIQVLLLQPPQHS